MLESARTGGPALGRRAAAAGGGRASARKSPANIARGGRKRRPKKVAGRLEPRSRGAVPMERAASNSSVFRVCQFSLPSKRGLTSGEVFAELFGDFPRNCTETRGSFIKSCWNCLEFCRMSTNVFLGGSRRYKHRGNAKSAFRGMRFSKYFVNVLRLPRIPTRKKTSRTVKVE